MRHRVKWSDCYWPPHVGRIEATIVFLLYFWRPWRRMDAARRLASSSSQAASHCGADDA